MCPRPRCRSARRPRTPIDTALATSLRSRHHFERVTKYRTRRRVNSRAHHANQHACRRHPLAQSHLCAGPYRRRTHRRRRDPDARPHGRAGGLSARGGGPSHRRLRPVRGRGPRTPDEVRRLRQGRRDRDVRHRVHRDGLLGHQGQGPRGAGVAAARRPGDRPRQGVRQRLVHHRAHPRGVSPRRPRGGGPRLPGPEDRPVRHRALRTGPRRDAVTPSPSSRPSGTRSARSGN